MFLKIYFLVFYLFTGEGFENEQDRSENETNIKGTSEQKERERVGGNTETGKMVELDKVNK